MDGLSGGLIFTLRTTVVSSTFPLWRSVSLDANANCTPDIVRKSELCCSIVVGVGSTSTCNGRTSRRRVINQVLDRHIVSCCSRRSALTARRNTEYHQCSLARPARSDGHVISIRASQIIFPVVQLRAGVLRSPF